MKRRVFFALGLALLTMLAPTPPATAQPSSLSTLLSANSWINAQPTAQSLKGKVVLVDVFTFGCYNCKNVTPNLKTLNRSYPADLAIVGIHTPETGYERERANVISNLKAQGISWPVAVDNDYALWHAFGVEYWPTQFIFDRRGHLRKTVIGDSQDSLVDTTVKELIAERT